MSSPDATGFSGIDVNDATAVRGAIEPTLKRVIDRLDAQDVKLDDIIYQLEQIQERLLDLDISGPGYSATD